MIDYKPFFKKPFQDFKILIYLLVLQFIPIVSLINKGYFLECGYLSVYRRINLPRFKEVHNLFWNGLVASIIQTIYLIPAIIAFTYLYNYFFTLFNSFSDLTAVGTASIDLLFSNIYRFGLLGIIFLIFGLYFGPLAAMNYRIYNKFTLAFSPSLLNFALRLEYLEKWLIGSVYLFALLGISYMLLSVNLWLAIVCIYLSLVVGRITLYSLIGQAYANIHR